MRQLFLKNAAANILGGVGGAVFNLLLPALAVRHLTKLEFSVWSLSLQIIVYIQLFGFGLQTAITRFIAHSNELNDIEDQRKTIKAAIVLAFLFVTLAAIAVLALAILYPLFFANLPKSMVTEFRTCVVFLGVSAAWQLFSLIPLGVFTGMHKNLIPVGGQLFVRLISLLAIWFVIGHNANLFNLSLVLAICSALIVPFNYVSFFYFAPNLLRRLSSLSLDIPRFNDLIKYCGGLAVWNVSMLLVNGIDLAVAGYFDFERVGAYSLASTAMMIMVGVQQAVMSPLVAIGARLYAKPEARLELPRVLIKATKYCVLIMGFIYVFMLVVGKEMLSFWVSIDYVNDVFALILILLVGYWIRTTATPYSMLLISTGVQNKILWPAILEAMSNLIASIFFAQIYGVFGVALGMVTGSIIGVLGYWVGCLHKTRALTPNAPRYIFNGIVFPSIFPIFIILFIFWHGNFFKN